METDKYNVSDLVVSAIDQKPIEFENAFNSIITDRIATAVNDRKIEVSNSMFGGQQDINPEE